MKAIFPGLINIDSSGANLEQESGNAGPGFEALLALAAARPQAPAQPIKGLAPNLDVVPTADSALELTAQPPLAEARANGSLEQVVAKNADAPEVEPTADPVATEVEPTNVEAEPGALAAPVASPQLPAAPAPKEPVLPAKPAIISTSAQPTRAPRTNPEAPSAPAAAEPATKRSTSARQNALGHGLTAERNADAKREQPSPELAQTMASASDVALQGSLMVPIPAPAATPAQPLVAKTPTTTPVTATAAPAPARSAELTLTPADESVPLPEPTAAGSFAHVLHAPQHGSAAHDTDATTALAPATATTTAPEPPPAAGTVDPETGARVVKIEYFSTKTAAAQPAQPAQANAAPAPAAPSAPSPREPAQATAQQPAAQRAIAHTAAPAPAPAEATATTPEQPTQDAPIVTDTRADDKQPSGDERNSSEREPGREPSSFAREPQPHAYAAQREPEEVRGIRGLDAVVASLLRAGNEQTPAEAARASHMPVATSAPAVVTEKSSLTKQNEKLSMNVQSAQREALQRDALQREEERRAALELTAPEPHAQHAFVDLNPRVDANVSPERVPEPLLPAPLPLPDADAASMGKLARGEGVDGAAISIEHPELGAMDVIVESENGRIDVRATLDTPRAAAVLRAHESALRYGIQQAGMTFGALRVRARHGESQTTIKSEGSVKRRRGNEWEA